MDLQSHCAHVFLRQQMAIQRNRKNVVVWMYNKRKQREWKTLLYAVQLVIHLSVQGTLPQHRQLILYLLINLKSFAAPPGGDKCQVQRQGSVEPIKTITEAPSSPLLPWPDNSLMTLQ